MGGSEQPGGVRAFGVGGPSAGRRGPEHRRGRGAVQASLGRSEHPRGAPNIPGRIRACPEGSPKIAGGTEHPRDTPASQMVPSIPGAPGHPKGTPTIAGGGCRSSRGVRAAPGSRTFPGPARPPSPICSSDSAVPIAERGSAPEKRRGRREALGGDSPAVPPLRQERAGRWEPPGTAGTGAAAAPPGTGQPLPPPLAGTRDRAVAQPRTRTTGFLLAELLNLGKHRFCLSPWIFSFCFTALFHRAPEHCGVEGTVRFQAPVLLLTLSSITRFCLTEPRTPQQPGDPEPRDPHHPPHRATTAGPCCRGCPPMGHCPAASKPFVPAGPGLYRALPQPGLEKTFLRVLAQHTPSLEKQRPVPSSPKTPHAQTLPLHTQAEFSPFTQNCLSPSLSLGLIQPFGLGLFLIAGTISVWARNPPFNPPTLFPFQIPGNINSCFSMAPKQATWAGSVLQSC